ncbi:MULTISPECIES: oligosaccharide flippase family protein [unclassified Staphylococcus]|uniref:oligosaccharide flippase family protein n=1 Tax=unclassified Staphylococcus TaxID=91994 RepID=UPI0021D3BB80|nr:MULTISPECIES: oligosaccharide flippase family protein [unclassified Staphylococcus]UXR71807.1 oligosaccharide flippase family protein [Staphylococcus sp. IVB6240]UXR74113.1 oligosaccharide flippase family protein [Staphylococcus sp. IVB6238]UXR76503.1 oligosaccharide flippase family protein [Staphylococcus sp. IVB6233]UXR80630.1 oligosaccharide flippase family protein [Staphylococcus sp. IVB6218]
MKSKAAFNGVVVLTVALIAVKVLSALYRVPYQNVLGDEGLYAYQQIYPIVALGVVLSSNAIPSAFTQILDGRPPSRPMFRRLILIMEPMGILIWALLYMGAGQIARWMGDPQLTPMLQAASVSFLVVGILGLLRGHFQAQHQMNYPAYSQVIEQCIRVGIIGIVIVYFIRQDVSIYTAGTWAIYASTAGFIVSTLYLWWRRDTKSFEQQAPSLPLRQFFIAIIIFAVSHLIVILWQVVDSFTIVNMLRSGAGYAFQDAIMQKGIYDRGASFIQMGLIVTTTFCFVLVPLLTDTKRRGAIDEMNSYANASLKMTIVISSASGIGLMNLLPNLNRVFFESNALTMTLTIYMLTVICVSMMMMYMALLEIYERYRLIIGAVLMGLVSKLALNILLITHIEMLGASLATVLSLVITVMTLHQGVVRCYQLHRLKNFYGKLAVSLVIMTVTVQLSQWLIPATSRFGSLLELLVAAMIGVLTIGWMLVRLNILDEEEWSHLPFGDKMYNWKKRRK